MATVEDVASLALSAIDSDAASSIGIEQVARWVAQRYAELVAKARFRHKRQVGTITIPAAIIDGTVTATLNSAAVTLDATAQAAVATAGGNTVIGTGNWWIRLGPTASPPGASVWYQVASYTAPTLTLANVFTSETVTGGSFVLLPRYHTLAADARWMGKFVFPRRRRSLQMRAYMDLDRVAPDRILSAEGPWFVAEASNTITQTGPPAVTGGIKRVEMYPYSQTEETIYYVYWNLPILATDPTALLDTVLPQEIDPYVLREGVLIDLYRYRASQAMNAGSVEGAGYWRNESRAQMTSWMTQIADAARTDRGQDDVSFVYHYLGLGAGRGGLDGRGEIYDGFSQWVAYGWPT